MSNSQLASEVLKVFPEAHVSIDDGESLRFRTNGFVCGARLLANRTWSVEVRDVRIKTFEEANELGEDNIPQKHLVVPTLKRLLELLLHRSS